MIDRETTSSYSLTILACHSDHTAVPAAAAAAAAVGDDDNDDVNQYNCAANISLSLLVNVQDANDNPPRFDRYVLCYLVKEK